MLMTTVIISSSFTVGKVIAKGLDPGVLVLIRYTLAALIFLPIVVAKNGLALPSFRQFWGYSAISASTAGFFWCMFEALRHTTALNTSVIYTLVPGISSVYSAIFLRERLGRNRLLAILFGMFGAVWVIFRGNIERLLFFQINHGDLLFLAGCFLIAAYTPLVKKIHCQESMLTMTFWVLATGAGWMLLLCGSHLATINWQTIEVEVWGGIIYLAVFSTIVTFYLTHLATLYLGPTRVMAYSYFYPPFVLLLDWSLGNGLPSIIIIPGIAVISLATLVVQTGARKD